MIRQPFGGAMMHDLVWDESYNIGIEEIDRQHMEFIKLLRRFNFGLQNNAPLSLQLRILNELVKYADYHFSSEENILYVTRYPDFAVQQEEHRRILRWLARRVEGYNRMPQTGAQLAGFLYAWFIDHTQAEDRKVAVYVCAEKKYSDSGVRVDCGRT
jgi:hemerythrin-like metal-binding protein